MAQSILIALYLILKQRIQQGTKTRGGRAGLMALFSFVLLIMKYPNRAIGTAARPDLDGISWKGKPLIGNTYTILKTRDTFLTNIVDNFETLGRDTMSTTILGLGRVIAINNPVLLEHILKGNFYNYEKGFILNSTLSQLLGNVFNSDRQVWQLHRKTASHIFSTKIYRSLIDGAFTEHTLHLCSILERAADEGRAVDLQAMFLRLTLDAFAHLSFGLDVNSLGKDGQDPFGAAFDYAVVKMDERFMNPLWRITEHFSGKARKMKDSVAIVHSYAHKAIQQRRNESTDEAITRQGAGAREDLLDLFMKWRDEEGNALDDDSLVSIFTNFLLAGRDTTAQALSWMYYEVMCNPTVEKNIMQEVDRLGNKPTYEMLTKDMRYSTAVFMESIRLYPPVPRNLKTAVADDVLPDGTQVKAGDRIMFSTYAINRNKNVWGAQAHDFFPERWFEENNVAIEQGSLRNSSQKDGYVWPKVRKENPFKFSSFNAGYRVCLGQTFATLEALTIINMISSRFHFELVPGQEPPQPLPSLTLPMKNPLMVKVYRRQQQESS